jgi:hypothetical protein
MKPQFPLISIPEDQKNPLVQQLLEFIEHQSCIIQQQAEQIQQLKDEIARIKKQPPRPKIKPSRLGKDKQKKGKSSEGKRPGSEKRSKTAELEIHHEEPVEPEHIPPGSVFRYYKDWVVQNLKMAQDNTCYQLKVYETPDGSFVMGKLPANLENKHYGPALIRFILYQHYHCHVTQPLLLEQLHEMGVDISAGHLNNILIEEKERFHGEPGIPYPGMDDRPFNGYSHHDTVGGAILHHALHDPVDLRLINIPRRKCNPRGKLIRLHAKLITKLLPLPVALGLVVDNSEHHQ